MNITKVQHEQLLSAAARADDTRSSYVAEHSTRVALEEKYGVLTKELEEFRERNHALATKVSIRDEALVQLALRLSFHGDAEPIAGTE